MRFWDFPASRDLEKPSRASASLSLWMNAGCGLGDPAARRWLRGNDQLSSTSAVEPAIGAELDTGSCVLAPGSDDRGARTQEPVSNSAPIAGSTADVDDN